MCGGRGMASGGRFLREPVLVSRGGVLCVERRCSRIGSSQALATLAANRRLADLLSEAFIEVYVDVKRNELQDFQKWMTPWEVRYLGSQL